jgi:DNA/RNA-binding domain of Phe-tRNA-synthetase-like protein
MSDQESGQPLLTVTDGWLAAYPGAVGGVLAMTGVANPATSEALEPATAVLETSLRARFAGSDRAALREIVPFPAYAAYYRRFQKTYHVLLQLESVALKGKPIPRSAALVEAMFMAELASGILTAGHDRAALTLPIRLDVANGSERYTLLSGKEQTLTRGDMYMADGDGIISDILFGPDRRSRIGPGTTEVLFAVYAPAGIGASSVTAHLADIAAKVRLIAPQAQIAGQQVVEA